MTETGERLAQNTEVLHTVLDEMPTEHAELKYRITDFTPEQLLAQTIEKSGLPPSVQAAFAPETIPLFEIGLPDYDVAYRQGAVQLRLAAVKAFSSLRRYMITEPQLPKHGKDRLVINPGRGVLLQEIRKYANSGLASLQGTRSVVVGLQLLYGGQTEPVWGDDDAADIIPTFKKSSDFAAILGSEMPDDLTFEDIAGAVAMNQDPGLSKEALDTRFNTFIGVLHVDLSNTAFHHLMTLATFSKNKTFQAMAFAARNQATFLSDNLAQKTALLGDINSLCHEIADQQLANSPRAKQRRQDKDTLLNIAILREMITYVDNVLINTDEFMQFFVNVYRELGHDLPPQLQEFMASPSPEEDELPAQAVTGALGGAVLENVVVIEAASFDAPATSEDADALDVEINALRADLAVRAEAALQLWRLSGQAVTNLKAHPLLELLQHGIQLWPRDPVLRQSGSWNLPPMVAEYDAQTFLGVLVHLDGTVRADGREAGLSRLEAYANEREALLAEAALIYDYAAEQAYERSSPALRLPSFENCLQRVADNWHLYRELFTQPTLHIPGLPPVELHTLPEGFAGNIWRLLPEPAPDSSYARMRAEYETYIR